MSHEGALTGILVADFSRVLAGPYASMLLGDLGADVVKVERPGAGDDTRHWGPPWRDGVATYYLGLNRNKRSVALDLLDPGDRELARRLALRADVMIESFRPGLMREWELDGDALRAGGNPRLVSCSVTAFGSGEAGAALPGYDLLLQAMGGLMSVTGEEDGRPLKTGAAVVDLICGLVSTIGILAALHERGATGAGSHVEVSLLESALAALLNQGASWALGGVTPHRRGNRHPSIAPYGTFEAADGHFALAVGNDRLFERLAGAIGAPELLEDPRYTSTSTRVENIDALEERLNAVFRTRTVAEWVERLRAAKVPVGPINDVGQAFELAEELGLGPIDRSTGLPLPAPPFGGVRLPPPRLDEHGDEIREWLRRL